MPKEPWGYTRAVPNLVNLGFRRGRPAKFRFTKWSERISIFFKTKPISINFMFRQIVIFRLSPYSFPSYLLPSPLPFSLSPFTLSLSLSILSPRGLPPSRRPPPQLPLFLSPSPPEAGTEVMGKQISVFLLEMENKAIQQRESENISNFVAYLRLNYQK